MRNRRLLIVSLALLLVTTVQGQEERRFVVLPARAAGAIASGGTWQITKADIDGLEASLSQISGLRAEGWRSSIHIKNPEQYFRQYVAIIRDSKKGIYVNAFCNRQDLSYWRDRLVVVDDGATCYWQAVYDPITKKFSSLRINSRA
jgi:hypothetical protein